MLYVLHLLYELIRLHRSDPFDLIGVITPTQDAHVDELLLAESQPLHHSFPSYL